MERKKLDTVREYEREAGKQEEKLPRPVFHLTPLTGWMNDPNGFSVYQGEYHLFYQYYPYDVSWNSMHWGHAKTKDFIRWEYLPAALAPDQKYDAAGVFSGSAMEEDGKHILMYTAVREEEAGNGKKAVRQEQCIAVGDGTDYEKFSHNPVITADLLPEGSSLEDFRDPKLWKEDGVYYAAVGSRSQDGSGQILLFSSGDLKNWKLNSVLARCANEYGKMWECPDFFPLDGGYVLIVSPQDMHAEGLEFHNGNGTVVFTGQYDKEAGRFLRETAHAADYGLDFYAPQTLETPDGRRIMTAWMKSWDVPLMAEGASWNGMMIIPRELTLKDGRLYQNPVRELEAYRTGHVSYENFVMGADGSEETVELEGISGRTLDLTIDLMEGSYRYFEMRFAQNEKYYCSIRYDREESVLMFDRTYSGLCRDWLCTRSMKAEEKNGKLRMRILLDLYSAEIFVNDGEKAMTSIFFTDPQADRITFSAKGELCMSVDKYNLEDKNKNN